MMRSRDWAYQPLVEWLNEGHRSRAGEARSWVHCDQLTLHRRGECTFCDEYAPDAQLARAQRGIPFSGEEGAPDAFFRSDETIKRWGGNRPATDDQHDTLIGNAGAFEGTLLVPSATYRLVPAPTPICVGDGSQFCCVRNGCHAVCNCTRTSPRWSKP